MPINLINKAVFAKMTRINFRLTVSDFLDFTIVTIVTVIWVVVIDYETSDLSYPLFSPDEDQTLENKFMGNISFNIIMLYLKLSLEFLYLAASILTTFVHSEDVDADKFQLL